MDLNEIVKSDKSTEIISEDNNKKTNEIDLDQIVKKSKEVENLTKSDVKTTSTIIKQDTEKPKEKAKEPEQNEDQKITIKLMKFGDWFEKQKFENVHKVDLKVRGIDPKQYALLSYKNDIKKTPERLLYCYSNYMVPDVPGIKIRIFPNSSMFIIQKIDDNNVIISFGTGKGKKLVVFVCWYVNNIIFAYKRINVNNNFQIQTLEKIDTSQNITNDKREELEMSYQPASKLRDKKTYYEICEVLTNKFHNVMDVNHLKNILSAEVKMFS